MAGIRMRNISTKVFAITVLVSVSNLNGIYANATASNTDASASSSRNNDSLLTNSNSNERWGKSIKYNREIMDNYLNEFYDQINKMKNNKKNDVAAAADEFSHYPIFQIPPNPFKDNSSDSEENLASKNNFKHEQGKVLPKSTGLLQQHEQTTKRMEEEVSVKDPTPKLSIISQFLHPENKPFVNFTVSSNRILYRFEVSPEVLTDNYMISVAVERMHCKVGGNNTAKLYIGGEMGETYLCKDIDDTSNNFQTVDHITDGDRFVNISGIGDWNTSKFSATLVASIYFETPHWQNCESKDHFSCGTKEIACKKSAGIASSSSSSSSAANSAKSGQISLIPLHLYPHYSKTKRSFLPRSTELFRCIPKHDKNGVSLLCNDHPNCGFHCNADELPRNCPKKDNGDDGGNKDNKGDDEDCPGYTCRQYQQDKFLITALLLVIFCIFIPLSIFLFICNKKDFRRNRNHQQQQRRNGRCHTPLEIVFCPFSMSADDGNGASQPQHSSNSGSNPNQNQTGFRQQQQQRNPRGTRQQQRQERNRNNSGRRAQRGTSSSSRRSEEINSMMATSSPVNYGRGQGMDNFSFFDDLPPSYTECINNKEMYPTAAATPGNLNLQQPPPNADAGNETISLISGPSLIPARYTRAQRQRRQQQQNLHNSRGNANAEIFLTTTGLVTQEETAFGGVPPSSLNFGVGVIGEDVSPLPMDIIAADQQGIVRRNICQCNRHRSFPSTPTIVEVVEDQQNENLTGASAAVVETSTSSIGSRDERRGESSRRNRT